MIWFTLALFAASFFLSALLTPKPQIEDARAGKLGDLKFPRVDEGAPVPMIFGRVRMRAPNVIWYGNFKSSAQKEKVKTGLFSSKKVVTGYKYFVGFDLALALGENTRLHKIWVEKKTLWNSGGGSGLGTTTLYINKPGIFGGSKKGGGMQGWAEYYAGDVPQSPSSHLESYLGEDVPGYPGVAHIYFRQLYVGTSPSIRPLSFEISRYPDNLSLGAGVIDVGQDINPMAIIYDLITDPWGGVNVDPSVIDTTSFTAIAATLATEGNGMSMMIQSPNDVEGVVEEVLRQIDGILYQDPVTGKVNIRLIRDDYVLEDLPILNEVSIKELRNFSRNSWAETTNQVRVTYTNRTRNYESGCAMVQDLANITHQDRIRSITVSFPGCTKNTLAVNLATRELSQVGIPLFNATLELNRQAFVLRPGDPFILQWADYGISESVMRAQNFDLGELLSGRIVMDCIQDKFAVGDAVYAAPEDSSWEEELRTAVDVTQWNAFESPYWFIEKFQNLFIPPDPAYLWCLARQSEEYLEGYDFVVSDDVFNNDITFELSQIPFPSSCLLNRAITTKAGQYDGTFSLIVSNPLIDDSIFINSSAAAIRAYGYNLFIINGEIMAYETYTDNLDGTYTLNNVHRALLDTQWEDHSVGDPIFFIDSSDWMSESVRPDVDSLSYQILTFTDQDNQDVGAFATQSISTNQRYDRPLAPDEITVESTRCPLEVIGVTDIDVDITLRNRTTETIVFIADGAAGEEGSTTYNTTVTLDGLELASSTGDASSAFPINLSGLLGSGTMRVEVEAVRGSLASWTPDFVEFFYANYPNLSSELLTNPGFESALTSGWSVQSGSWSRETANIPLHSQGSYILQSDGTTNELRQTVDITSPDYRGKVAIFRIWKGSWDYQVESQVIVEILDSGSSVLDSVTTTLDDATWGEWAKIEVYLPIPSNANYVRVRIIAPTADAVFEDATLKANTVSPQTAVKYDSVSGLTVLGAWGLRQMVSTYSGSLVKIRDEFDDTEFDVGQDYDGNLEPFHTRGNARVVRLYDQSGNDNHLEPESEATQPILKFGLCETGRPSIFFDGDGDTLLDTVASTSRDYMVARPNCAFSITRKEGTSNAYLITIPHNDALHTSPYYRLGMTTGSTDWRYSVDGTQRITSGNGNSNVGLNVWFMDYQNGAVYHNDDVTAVDTFTATDISYPENTRLRFAETVNGLQMWRGEFHELCIFSGNIASGDRQTIMEDLSEYWSNFTA
jgi:hypothetical protein